MGAGATPQYCVWILARATRRANRARAPLSAGRRFLGLRSGFREEELHVLPSLSVKRFVKSAASLRILLLVSAGIGFRRRSNSPSSVSRVTGLAHVPNERLPCVQQVVTSHLLFRIILQYAAVFQPRVLFLFRGTRNILPTKLNAPNLTRFRTFPEA